MYRKFTINLFILFQLTTGFILENDQDKRKDADITQFPFTAELNGPVIRGGGIIISSNVILTSGSDALAAQNGQLDTVSFGGNELDGSDIIKIRIAAGVTHPDFTGQSKNNIGLVYLEGCLDFSTDKVKRVNLPETDSDIPEKLILSGYASERPSINEPPTTLKYEFIKEYNHEKCAEVYARKTTKTINENVTCIMEYEDENINLTMGDFGYPLTMKGVVYGIISILPNGNDKELPAAFTKVARYVEWIKKNADI